MLGSELAGAVRPDLLRKGILIMKLQEKILYCRKKAGLSQESLAERTGVSRQAVSKWETGEALPEIGKLALLARTFGVTTDWLLSEEEPESEGRSEKEERQRGQEKQSDAAIRDMAEEQSSNWVESIPGVIGTLVKRYGWLCGVYVAFVGAGFIGIGILARVLIRYTFSGNPLRQTITADFYGAEYFLNSDISGNLYNNAIFATENPVSIMGTAMIILGVFIMVVGIVAAVILKKKIK